MTHHLLLSWLRCATHDSKLAIFKHLWTDSPAYVKRAKIHFKDPIENTEVARATKQRAIETLDIEPHEDSPGPEEEDAAENDPFAGYHGHSDPTIAESDSWLSQGTIDYKKGDVKAF